MTDVDDCSEDPGPLTGDDAVLAMSRHHACPGLCWPKLRALVGFDGEYGVASLPPAVGGVDDTQFAEQLRQAMHHAADRDIRRLT